MTELLWLEALLDSAAENSVLEKVWLLWDMLSTSLISNEPPTGVRSPRGAVDAGPLTVDADAIEA